MDRHQHVRENTHLWNRSRLPLRLTERVLCFEEECFFYIPLICLPLTASSDFNTPEHTHRHTHTHTHHLDGLTHHQGGPRKSHTFMLEAILTLLPMDIHHVSSYLNDFEGVATFLSCCLCLIF